jgi:transcriptional regulator with XRE-family HTH domain
MSDPKAVTWLRPEYKGREDELVNLAAGAALVGVSRSAVSNWAKRHSNFPKIALLAGIGDRRVKYVPRSEFLEFARAQLSKKRTSGRRSAPRRPTVLLRADEIAHSERQIARLTELESRQAAALVSTRQALSMHRERLKRASQRLAAEIAVVHRLERGEGIPGTDSETPAEQGATE